MADRRLQVFHTVARLLSFTKAAETLHMTQPAVTFQVRQLEEHFNTRLFDRTHNRISLTAAGERVYEYAERILTLYAEMNSRVRDIAGDVSGILLIGASTTIAEYVLPALLAEFQVEHRDVHIRLSVSNSLGIVHMVESNVVDVGIVEAPVGNKNLAVDVCWHDRLVVICPPGHPLAAKASVHVRELLDLPFLVREEGSGTREVISEYLSQNDLQWHDMNLRMEFGSPESVKSAVEAGLGISIVSHATVSKELKLGLLAALPLEPVLERPFSLVYQRQKFRLRAVEEFMRFARAQCQRQTGAPTGGGEKAT